MSDGGFNPREEVPALLEEIAELAPGFRDVFEGNPQRGLELDARALCAAADRLVRVCQALTATALAGSG